MNRLAVVSILIIGSCSANVRSAPRGEVNYEPAVVTVQGTFTIVARFGPPNFGEDPTTDAKVQVPILVLSSPLNVQGDPKSDANSQSVRGLTELQLILPQAPDSYQELVGKEVVARGTLFQAQSGHHFTAVVMTVESVRPGE